MHILQYLRPLVMVMATCYASSEDDYSVEWTRRLVPIKCQRPPPSSRNSTRTHLMWFYNASAARCQAYAADLRDGAENPEPADNSFTTLQECNKKCRDEHYGMCGGPKNDTVCKTKGKDATVERRFWFDPDNRTCRPYMYGGCHPNSNTYRTRLECLTDCAEFIENRCYLPIDEGSCYDTQARYAFNSVYQDCEEFMYTGCEGNRNNFKTAKECWLTCANKSRCLKHTQENSEWYRPFLSYFYDVDNNECKPTKTFFPKSKGPKTNRFETKQECERNCMRKYKRVNKDVVHGYQIPVRL